MSYANPQYLVESDWLEAHLDDPELRIFDCMVLVHSGEKGLRLESGCEAWAQGHIPGSGFVDLVTELSNPDHRLPLMMPNYPVAFQFRPSRPWATPAYLSAVGCRPLLRESFYGRCRCSCLVFSRPTP